MKPLLFSLLFAQLFAFSAKAQGSNNSVIVKFNYSYLNFDFIDDPSALSFTLKSVLNSRAKVQLHNLELIHPGIGEYQLTKIFPFLSTKDTVSISRLGQKVTIPPFWAAFTLTTPASENLVKLIADLNSFSPLIEYCHYNFEASFATAPSDTLYSQQTSLNGSALHPNAGINIENAWLIETGKSFIKVGIHDSGIDTLHPDLKVVFGAPYLIPDPSTNYGWGEDTKVHGTPVAGIIGAKRNNVTGVAGIAGGDTTAGSGCSLIDLRVNFYNQSLASFICASVVDAARSVGSYWDYPDSYYDSSYFNATPGFGVHISNHSYIIKTDLPIPQDPTGGGGTGTGGDDDDNGNGGNGGTRNDGGSKALTKELNDSTVANTPICELCREAYLFSYKNAVINVVARGNSQHFSPYTDPTLIDYSYPQSFPDNWIISVGASGYDGYTVQQGLNQSAQEAANDYWSMYGGNMDIIAPGSDSIVYTTDVINNLTESYPYEKFNGTSAAAPHVSGVVALLLSHYNMPNCYSNRNLAVEDVEYILEHSAINLYGTGYDDTTGWGRLDAYKALKMIENSTLQIIHPDSVLLTEEISRDTIALGYDHAFVSDGWGPISRPYPLEVEREYKVVRYLMQNTYSFADYYSSTTDILGYWPRQSASNSLVRYEDTTNFIAAGTPAGTLYTYSDFNFMNDEPYVEIMSIDSVAKTITTQGYYYHFINQYIDVILNTAGATHEDLIVDGFININEWHPINPFTNTVKMPVSIYMRDTTWEFAFEFPCDTINPLFDENFHLGNMELENNLDFYVYPNPSNSIINIVNQNNQPLGNIEIADLTGNSMVRVTENDSQTEVDISYLASGIYMISCNDGKVIRTIKFIKL